MKRLLWQDICPTSRMVMNRRSKTDAVTRVIPLNEQEWSVISAMKQRADTLGTYAPEHCVFHRLWPEMGAMDARLERF